MAFHAVVMKLEMALMTVLTVLEIVVHTAVKNALIPFQTVSVTDFMAFQTVVTVLEMAVHALVRKVEMAVTTVVKIFLILSHRPVKNSQIAVHAVLFFFVITLTTIYIVLRNTTGTDGRKFVSSYMLSRIIKIFSCLIFLVLYLLLNKNDSLRFAIAFLVIYFLYSIFEVVVLKKENQELSK